MKKGNTKEQILDAALDLFSVKGYEATSISQIADAVGIRKASLYSHFSSKQAILDTMINETIEEFNCHSIFVKANWENPEFTNAFEDVSPEVIFDLVKKQMIYILHDPKVHKIRNMLTIEQFRNSELGKLHCKMIYEDINTYNIGLMNYLINKGELVNRDPEIMAAQFAWPISVWIGLCDRDPNREKEVIRLLEKHIKQFWEVYKK